MMSVRLLRNICGLAGLAVTLSACSWGDYFGDMSGEDYSAGYYGGGSSGGVSVYDSAYGGGASGGYGQAQMAGYGANSGCMGGMGGGYGAYAPGGSARYGGGELRGYSGSSARKSRYGSYSGGGYGGASGANMAGCGGGYYMIPTYQIMQQPAPAPAPVVTVPSVVIPETTCPDGQYKMANGDCAIMQTEQYEPPVVSSGYIEPVTTPLEYYEPIRK